MHVQTDSYNHSLDPNSGDQKGFSLVLRMFLLYDFMDY